MDTTKHGKKVAKRIKAAGYETTEKIAAANLEEFSKKTGLPKDMAEEIIKSAKGRLQSPVEKPKEDSFKESVTKELQEKTLKNGKILKNIGSDMADLLEDSPEFRQKLLNQALKDASTKKKIVEAILKKLT